MRTPQPALYQSELAAEDYSRAGHLPSWMTAEFARFLRSNPAVWDANGESTILRPLQGFEPKFTAWYAQTVVAHHAEIEGGLIEGSWAATHHGWVAQLSAVDEQQATQFTVEGHDNTQYKVTTRNQAGTGW